MKWIALAASLVAIGVGAWLLGRRAPAPPKLGEYAIEEPPRAPGVSARDVETARDLASARD